MPHQEQYDTVEQTHSSGVNSGDRQQMLLDDLHAEIERLADAVERQNELLEDSGHEVER